MPLSSGQVLNNRYRIVKLLGQGGFGAVYRAWDMNLERPCALKENLDTTPQAQRQFKREAQILFDLTHPNLPRVIDHFVIQGQGQYLVMEFVEGEDLGEMLARAGKPLPEMDTLKWAEQICNALTYLHNQNPPVIHRDIKPKNIRITPQGQAVLVDFGIAKIFDANLQTTVGARAVTPGYSPPEQYGQGATDAQSDIYSLGATLYTLLTGKQPPESVYILADSRHTPPTIRALNPAVSERTSAAVAQAMQVDRTRRFDHVDEFRRALTASPNIVSVRTDYASGEKKLTSALTMQPATDRSSPPPVGGVIRTTRPVAWGWIGLLVGLCVLSVVVLTGIGILQSNIFSPKTSTPGVDRTGTSMSAGLTEVAVVFEEQTRSALIKQFAALTQTASISRPTAETLPPLVITTPPTVPPTHTPTPTFTPTDVPEDINNDNVNPKDGAKLVWIPAGEFTMGLTDAQINFLLANCSECKASGFAPSKPAHTVYLDSYWIYQTEVTNSQYALCEQAGACFPPLQSNSSTHASYYDNPRYADYPVVFVDWSAAKSYCQWAGGLLPSEAQWEKAARGTDARLYPWGDIFPSAQYANVGKSVGDTTQAGAYPAGASPYGVLDMAGNVYEWVQDWYAADYYSRSPYQNPQGPDGPSGNEPTRVIRGGNWFWNGAYATAGYHDYWEPFQTSNDVGFRCVVIP